MTDGTYDTGFTELVDDTWDTADIRMLLLDDDAGLTFDRVDVFVDDVLAHAGNVEMSGTGYAREIVPTRSTIPGISLANIAHGDVLFAGIDAGVAGAAVYYRHVNDDTDSPVIFFKQSGFPFTTSGNDMTVRVGANGVAIIRDLETVE
jgi:hypothetical protein